MSRSLFWLSDEAWSAIAPHLPKNQPGARLVCRSAPKRDPMTSALSTFNCCGNSSYAGSQLAPIGTQLKMAFLDHFKPLH
jgi:transposase